MTVWCYAVERENTSPRFAAAFAAGCPKARITTEGKLLPGPVAMFGSPQIWHVLQDAQMQGRTWYYGDHAYFSRRQFYRITRNAYQFDPGDPRGADTSRLDVLGIIEKRWRKGGRHVLLCPATRRYFELMGDNADAWIARTLKELRQFTDRPVHVRWKSDPRPLVEDLADAWATVVYTSIAGLVGALEGVPTFATAQCASRSFGTGDLSLIESPVRPDNRRDLAAVLAGQQWSMDEIKGGKAWRMLQR